MPDRAERRRVAKGFFRPPNQITWSAYSDGTLPDAARARIKPWIERLLRGEDPVFLPLATVDGTTWYAAARTARGFRHLREELKAFLGPAYSDFAGQPTHLDPDFPSERVLAEVYGHHVVRLRVLPRDRDKVAKRLALILRLRDDAPERGEEVPRPAGRVLADFDEAVRLGDEVAATVCIEELERNGQLDALNLLYLKIRAAEVGQRWQEVLDAAQRYGLYQTTRRPRRVSQAIVRAVYATELKCFEIAHDAQGAVERYRDVVGPLVGPLLTTRRAFDCTEADALFVMAGVTKATSQADLDKTLVSFASSSLHERWNQALIDTLPEPTLASPELPIADDDSGATLEEARRLYWEGDLDHAWSMATILERNEAVVPLLVICACDLGTLDAAKAALEAVESLDDLAVESLQKRTRFASDLDQLRLLVTPPNTDSETTTVVDIPQNWLEWALAIRDHQKWTEAAEVARRGADEWPATEFASPEKAVLFGEAIAELDNEGFKRITESLPHLLLNLGRCPELPKQFGVGLERLTDIHLLDEAPGQLFFATLASLSDLTLQVGISADGYGRLLQESLEHIAESRSARFEGLLDFLDVLVTHAAPDASLRTAVAGAIANLFVRFAHKADDLQVALLRQLLTDASCDIPDSLRPSEDASAEASPLSYLAGKSVALYSLKETVLHRVATVLEAEIAGVKVSTFHDKAGGSKALRAAARNADVFVVATAAASHAATGFIEAERPKDAPTLKPASQGSASMLRAIREFATASQASTLII